ncbi:hypothetical protein QNI19_36510 [Cytophagaceae bacterium DM2B3-1]|uniref:Uncharacterized protein n=1 Tax=Xanthocytophaga flava TaxID=3048013 RepID=A0ABT7CXK0_9BACT|nr:hypothetical protein [Xanthocytophaga flavus]MDJ1467473.1 hypothetical protein [Xanthocytophaga flavus]MDJ1498496.1 hypothetical protein [Xanthocytophaga flavus]
MKLFKQISKGCKCIFCDAPFCPVVGVITNDHFTLMQVGDNTNLGKLQRPILGRDFIHVEGRRWLCCDWFIGNSLVSLQNLLVELL